MSDEDEEESYHRDVFRPKPTFEDLEEFELKDVDEIADEAKKTVYANSKYYDDENLGNFFVCSAFRVMTNFLSLNDQATILKHHLG